MTKEELAESLNGLEYGEDIPQDLLEAARDSALIIVYGRSDDIMEFDGAMYDESYVSGWDVVKFDRKGLIPEWDDIEKDELQEVREYLERIDGEIPSEIKVMPEGNEGYFWSYETDIPHSTFEILEDGERYCRGIVFDLKDVSGF
jgi:hypothetical protein